jgi:predicted DNA-binding ribbon-helix-helix protein
LYSAGCRQPHRTGPSLWPDTESPNLFREVGGLGSRMPFAENLDRPHETFRGGCLNQRASPKPLIVPRKVAPVPPPRRSRYFLALCRPVCFFQGGLQLRNVRRSVVIKGRKTSMTLEEPFWAGLRQIAGKRGYTISGLVARIASESTSPNLSSTIRIYVLEYFKGFSEKSPPQ